MDRFITRTWRPNGTWEDPTREQFVYLLCTHLNLHFVCTGPNYWDYIWPWGPSGLHLALGTIRRVQVVRGGEENSPGGMGPLRRRLAEEHVWDTANLFFSPREYLGKLQEVSWECRNQGGRHCISWLSPHERVSRVHCPPPEDTFGRTRGKEGQWEDFRHRNAKYFWKGYRPKLLLQHSQIG